MQQNVEVLCGQIEDFQTGNPVVLEPWGHVLVGSLNPEVSAFQKETLRLWWGLLYVVLLHGDLKSLKSELLVSWLWCLIQLEQESSPPLNMTFQGQIGRFKEVFQTNFCLSAISEDNRREGDTPPEGKSGGSPSLCLSAICRSAVVTCLSWANICLHKMLSPLFPVWPFCHSTFIQKNSYPKICILPFLPALNYTCGTLTHTNG